MTNTKKVLNRPKKLSMAQSSWRWLVLPGWRRLHRVSKLDIDAILKKQDIMGGEGETVCGQKGFLSMPGVLGRIGLPRCHHCCRMTQIPDGLGNPRNDKKLRRISHR